MGEVLARSSFRKNVKLKAALLQHKALSSDGMSERLFGMLFSGLVYPQIWEDPQVDIDAMGLSEGHRIVSIGSGGCNMLAYLTRSPETIDVVDLNPNHIALNRLKLCAFRTLPDHKALLGLFGGQGHPANILNYNLYIRPHLDAQTRRHWDRRGLSGKRRIAVFNGNVYRTGLLGRFIGCGHLMARLNGVRLTEFAKTRTIEEQRRFFDERIAPLFDRKIVRFLTSRKSSLFGLGIPPQQYDELASVSADGTIASVLRERLEKLACHFPLKDNYFAWQAFARRYPAPDEGSLPLYLQESHFETIRRNAPRVTVHHETVTDLLSTKPAGSVDRYVLLDAQDWMTDTQLDGLWSEITRTAAPGARVIFRTAARDSILPGRVSDTLLGAWQYHAEQSAALNARDRSAIYGGFHIYEKTL